MVTNIKLSVSIDEDLVAWIDQEIKEKRFASRTHAFEYAIKQLMKKPKP